MDGTITWFGFPTPSSPRCDWLPSLPSESGCRSAVDMLLVLSYDQSEEDCPSFLES